MKDAIFYAKIEKGYIPKVIFDAMATNLTRIPMELTKQGINICMADRDDAALSPCMWATVWERKKISSYTCLKSKTISISVKQLQKMLKNVKKKESLTFYILKSDPTKMRVVVQPTVGKTTSSKVKGETFEFAIQEIKSISPIMPEIYRGPSGKDAPQNVYGYPIVIDAIDFQRIKKLMAMCKTSMIITIQKDNYLSFSSGNESVVGLVVEFGELTYTPNSDSDEEEDQSEEKEEEGEEDEEDEEEEDEEEDEEDVDNGSDDGEEYPHVYSKTFSTSLFTPLIKLPCMCTQMEFYAPKINGYPLKINMAASSGLGDTTIYIKDKEYMDMVTTKTKGKK